MIIENDDADDRNECSLLYLLNPLIHNFLCFLSLESRKKIYLRMLLLNNHLKQISTNKMVVIKMKT